MQILSMGVYLLIYCRARLQAEYQQLYSINLYKKQLYSTRKHQFLRFVGPSFKKDLLVLTS